MPADEEGLGQAGLPTTFYSALHPVPEQAFRLHTGVSCGVGTSAALHAVLH